MKQANNNKGEVAAGSAHSTDEDDRSLEIHFLVLHHEVDFERQLQTRDKRFDPGMRVIRLNKNKMAVPPFLKGVQPFLREHSM